MEKLKKNVSDFFSKLEKHDTTKNEVRCYMSSADFEKKDFKQGFMMIESKRVEIIFSHGELHSLKFQTFISNKSFQVEDFFNDAMANYEINAEMKDYENYWTGIGDVKIEEVETIKEVEQPLDEYNRAKAEVLDNLLSRKTLELTN
jgi:hypothetical protein